MVVANEVLFTKKYVFFGYFDHVYIFFDSKINNDRGNLSDISAKTGITCSIASEGSFIVCFFIFGYFDPLHIFFDDKNKQSSG